MFKKSMTLLIVILLLSSCAGSTGKTPVPIPNLTKTVKISDDSICISREQAAELDGDTICMPKEDIAKLLHWMDARDAAGD